jgi:hypothetical protein
MNARTLFLTRFLTRTKHHPEARLERVEGVFLQEHAIGIVRSSVVSKEKNTPAEVILAETTCIAYGKSVTATALFIP